MQLELMQKEQTVAVIDVDENGILVNLVDVMAPDCMPFGIMDGSQPDVVRLRDWWSGRSIPASRTGIRNLLDALQISAPQGLLSRSMGLSLSDQYWVRKKGTDVKWKDINFFENDFSVDIGDLLFSKARSLKEGFSFESPDNTTDGVLKKRWKIIDGKRCLLKGGSDLLPQQPFNEVIACIIMDAMGIDHVEYSIIWENGRPYSVCEDFIDTNTELVSANRILTSCVKNVSLYRRYVSCCFELGINVIPFLNRMMVVDYIMCNSDRHNNNYGLIRDVESLRFIDTAPLFDTGSSLGYNLRLKDMKYAASECRPFADTFEEQMGFVTDYSWIDFGKLRGTYRKIREVLESSKGLIEPERIDAICELIESRVDSLEKLAKSI